MNARWQLVLLVAVALICASLAQTQQGHVVLSDLGLYKSVNYTELAFSNPEKLPNALKKPNEDIGVSFGIHNVSTDAHSYHWSIELVHGTDTEVKASGDLLTAAQSRATVTKSVATSCASGRLQVVVQLANPSESISFWMTCPPVATKKKAGQ